jgi:hypothetical protein
VRCSSKRGSRPVELRGKIGTASVGDPRPQLAPNIATPERKGTDARKHISHWDCAQSTLTSTADQCAPSPLSRKC